MLLLKSDDDENETNADVLKRPRMCVRVVPLSRVTRGLYDRARGKVRKEKGSAYENPLNIKVCLEQTNVHSQLLCRGCLSSLSLS